jgi:hypothetical protein
MFALVMQFQIPLLLGISLIALEFLENLTTLKMYSIHDLYGTGDDKMLSSQGHYVGKILRTKFPLKKTNRQDSL